MALSGGFDSLSKKSKQRLGGHMHDVCIFVHRRYHMKTEERSSTNMTYLKALLGDLGLGGSNGLGGVGVGEAAAKLAVLELGALGGADAQAAGADLGTAGAAAVSVGDAAAGGELLALAVADILSTRGVGSESHDRDGDCGKVSIY